VNIMDFLNLNPIYYDIPLTIFLALTEIIPFLINIILINYFFEQETRKKLEIPLYKFLLFLMILLYALPQTALESHYRLIFITDFLFTIIILLLVGVRNHIPKEQLAFWSIAILLGFFSLKTYSLSSAPHIAFAEIFMFLFHNPPATEPMIYLFPSMLYSLLCVFFILGIKKFFTSSFNELKGRSLPVLISFLVIGFSSIFLLIYYIYDFQSRYFATNRFDNFLMLAIILLNVSILSLYKNIESNFEKLNKTTIENKEFETQIKQFHLLKLSQDKISAIKHDLKNEHILLLGLLKKGETAQAEEYLEEYLGKVEDTDRFYTNNPILNFLLNEKSREAKDKQVELVADVLFPVKTRIDNELIAVLIGNLLDNAINATARSSSADKQVHLIIKAFNQNLKIELSNPFDVEEVKTRAHRQNEGYGLKNIQRVVEEHDGLYKQWIEDGQYKTSIILFKISE